MKSDERSSNSGYGVRYWGVLLHVMEGGKSNQKSYVFRKPKLKHDILIAIQWIEAEIKLRISRTNNINIKVTQALIGPGGVLVDVFAFVIHFVVVLEG